MGDDTTDHRQAIHDLTQAAWADAMNDDGELTLHLMDIRKHADALASERDALRTAIDAALSRYERADAENGNRGFVRGSVAWAMADDLRQAIGPTETD